MVGFFSQAFISLHFCCQPERRSLCMPDNDTPPADAGDEFLSPGERLVREANRARKIYESYEIGDPIPSELEDWGVNSTPYFFEEEVDI